MAGNFGEKKLHELLDRAEIPNRKNPEKKSLGWDIQFDIGNKTLTAEVKYDQMESRTGNIAIEYFNTKKDKPSGILATISDFWVIVLQNPISVWITESETLLKYFKEVKCLREVHGGDNNSSMKLYNREEIFDALFTQIDLLDKKELIKCLKSYLK